MQEQALGLVRNLIDGPINSIDYVFVEDCLLLHAVGTQLQSATKAEVLIQVTPALQLLSKWILGGNTGILECMSWKWTLILLRTNVSFTGWFMYLFILLVLFLCERTFEIPELFFTYCIYSKLLLCLVTKISVLIRWEHLTTKVTARIRAYAHRSLSLWYYI